MPTYSVTIQQTIVTHHTATAESKAEALDKAFAEMENMPIGRAKVTDSEYVIEEE